MEVELHSQILHSFQTLDPGPTDLPLDGNSSQGHSRVSSHSLASPPELRVGPVWRYAKPGPGQVCRCRYTAMVSQEREQLLRPSRRE